MGPIKVCVFGSSAPSTKPRYVEESVLLGKLLAERGYLCVNGAGKSGCMGGVNDGTIAANGKVRGVIHKMFMVDSGEDSRLEDLVVCDGWDLSDRKAKLFENSDCVIVMPGGVGTFDELFDGVCCRSLAMKGLKAMPFCLVNIDGFYDGILEQMRRAKEDGILYLNVDEYFHTANSASDALDWCISQLKSGDSASTSPFGSSRVSQRDSRLPGAESHKSETTCSSSKDCSTCTSNVVVPAVCLGVGFVLGLLFGLLKK